MKKIKWEHILLFFLELLVNMATVGVAILLNALIDAAQISITSQDAHHLQKVLFISILLNILEPNLRFLFSRSGAYRESEIVYAYDFLVFFAYDSVFGQY